MSFLLEDDDQQTTLAVALAFIDACGSDDSSSSSEAHATSMDEETQPVATGTRKPLEVLTHRTPQQRYDNAGAEHSSGERAHRVARNAKPKCREWKRAEASLLRKQVVELESLLTQLQRAHVLKTTNWLEIAAAQVRDRHNSEALNIKLKAAVAKQLALRQVLESAVGMSSPSNVRKRTSSVSECYVVVLATDTTLCVGLCRVLTCCRVVKSDNFLTSTVMVCQRTRP